MSGFRVCVSVRLRPKLLSAERASGASLSWALGSGWAGALPSLSAPSEEPSEAAGGKDLQNNFGKRPVTHVFCQILIITTEVFKFCHTS